MSVYVYVDFPRDVAPGACLRGAVAAVTSPQRTLIRARRAHAVRRRGRGGGSGPSGWIRVSCCRTKYSRDGTSSPPVAPVSVILGCHSRTNTDTRCLNAPKTPRSGDSRLRLRAPGCRRDQPLSSVCRGMLPTLSCISLNTNIHLGCVRLSRRLERSDGCFPRHASVVCFPVASWIFLREVKGQRALV